MSENKVKAGDIVKATGLGEMFISMIPNSSGQGEVLHVGYGDGTYSTTDFPEKERFQLMYPDNYETGVFYRDTGNNWVLWLAIEDAEIITPA